MTPSREKHADTMRTRGRTVYYRHQVTRKIKCRTCGKACVAHSNNTLDCPGCRKARERERQRLHSAEQTKQKQAYRAAHPAPKRIKEPGKPIIQPDGWCWATASRDERFRELDRLCGHTKWRGSVMEPHESA